MRSVIVSVLSVAMIASFLSCRRGDGDLGLRSKENAFFGQVYLGIRVRVERDKIQMIGASEFESIAMEASVENMKGIGGEFVSDLRTGKVKVVETEARDVMKPTKSREMIEWDRGTHLVSLNNDGSIHFSENGE